MTPGQAKLKGYTHRGKLYGCDVYITDDEDMNVVGVNWFQEILCRLFIWLDTTFEFNDCFAIQKGEPL